MLDIIFHPNIENEVKSSFNWHQNKAVGLGEKNIFIVAVMHNSRKPNYWIERI